MHEFDASLASGSALELFSPTTELVIAGYQKSNFYHMSYSDLEMISCFCRQPDNFFEVSVSS